MNISDAALSRAIDQRKPTLFLDEVDAVFNPKTAKTGSKDDLRALPERRLPPRPSRLPDGRRKPHDPRTLRCVRGKSVDRPGHAAPTLAGRCVRIELTRRRSDEPVEDFYPDELDQAEAVRQAFVSWAQYVVETLRLTRPARIDGLRDRVNEVWRPLLAIAELTGEPWASRARRAAVAPARGVEDDETSLGVLLLGDVRIVFEEQEAERIATAGLIRPWPASRSHLGGNRGSTGTDNRCEALRDDWRSCFGLSGIARRTCGRTVEEGVQARGLRRCLGAIPAAAYKRDKRDNPLP